MIPLVTDTKRKWNDSPGWCTYFHEFADSPEVEFICGGINDKTPRASAVWRQGNLLHFGFDVSPSDMNDNGRALLVNSIVYIARFTEDRPIAITPSVFGSEHIAETRRRVGRIISNPDYQLGWLTNQIFAGTLKTFNWHDRATAKAWWDANDAWLHPGPGNWLEVDEEAHALGTPPQSPEFFSKTIALLSEESKCVNAAKILARYAPDGPTATATAAEWQRWWQANERFVFYSEMGGYRWYVDRLAQKRGVPTKDLRGSARATLSVVAAQQRH